MNDNLWPRLVMSTTGSFGLKLINVILGFLSSIVFVRLLGVNEFGIYTYVLSWIWLISVFTKMGFPDLVVREVANYTNMKQWYLLRGFLNFSNWTVLSLSILIIFGYFFTTYYLFPESIDPSLHNAFSIGVFLLPFISLTGLRQCTLRALQKIIQGQYPEYVIKPAGLLLCILAAHYLMEMKINAEIALILNLFVSVLVFSLGFYLLSRALTDVIRKTSADYKKMEWAQSAISFLLIGGMLMINKQTDKIMLGALSDISNVGIYSVMAQIAGFAGFTLIALNTAIAPTIVKLMNNGEKKRLQNIVTKSTRYALGGSFIITIILIVMSGFLLSLFGDEFVKAKPVLLVLLIGQIINVAAGSAGTILNMMGNEVIVAYVVAVSAVINIFLNYILIPVYGMLGASIATTISIVIWNVALVFILHRKERIMSCPIFITNSITNEKN